jgi:hypothetical protein
MLCARTETHRGVYDDVIESAISIEIDRKKVGVPVPLERLTRLVTPDDLRARLPTES